MFFHPQTNLLPSQVKRSQLFTILGSITLKYENPWWKACLTVLLLCSNGVITQKYLKRGKNHYTTERFHEYQRAET